MWKIDNFLLGGGITLFILLVHVQEKKVMLLQNAFEKKTLIYVASE